MADGLGICILSPYPPQTGGVPVHAENLAKALSKNNRIFVITYGRLGRKGAKNMEILEVPVAGVKFLRGLSFFLGSLIMLRRLSRKNRIDVIHSQYMHPMGTAALLYRKFAKNKPKVVVTAHGSDLLRLGQGRISRRLISWIGNSCDSLVCVSEHLKAHAVELGIDKGNIRTIYNGIEKREFPKMGKGDLRKHLKLPPEKKIITFAGSLSDAKGADIFVVLAQHLLEKDGSLFFVLVGGGSDRPWLEKLCRRSGIGGSVLFAGPRSHSETLEYIRASDVLVVPSRVEGFGLTALEGMCLGVPVAASRAGALPEILPEHSLTDNLPKTVMDILHDRKFRERMISENKKRGERFDWKLAGEETEKLYRSLEAPRGARHGS